MKRTTTILLAALLLCTGCQSKDTQTPAPDSSSPGSAAEVTTAPAESTEASSDISGSAESPVSKGFTADIEVTEEADTTETSIDGILFKPGVWLGSDSYFFFDGEGGGQLLSLENGIGIGFEVEPCTGDTVTFHMGSADSSLTCTVTEVSENSVTIVNDNGEPDTLNFVCEGNASTFTFYTNEELMTLALDYYQAQTGYAPQNAGVQNNPDGTATIQLYDSLGDHNSTSAWYTVDRVTGEGTDDMTGESINISAAG